MPVSPSSDLRLRHGQLGAAFVALVAVFIGGAGGYLDLTDHNIVVTSCTGVFLLIAAVVLASLPWDRLPRRALVASPAIIIVAIGVVGALSHSVAQSFLSFVTLCAVYLGVTQPPRTTAYAMPFLVADWWLAYTSHPNGVLVRLPLAVVVWMIVGELIARSTFAAGQEVSALTASVLTDPLTQLGNRRTLNQELANLPAGGMVMFLDLDFFKAFNDRYGHAAGDTLLVSFATTVKRTLRSGDLVARFGGEEFVILLPVCTNGGDVYERIRTAWNASGAPITFSAGIAQRLQNESPVATMRRSDQALYRAKSGGRDQYVLDVACVDDENTLTKAADEAHAGPGDHEFGVDDMLEQMRAGKRTKRRLAVPSDEAAVPFDRESRSTHTWS